MRTSVRSIAPLEVKRDKVILYSISLECGHIALQANIPTGTIDCNRGAAWPCASPKHLHGFGGSCPYCQCVEQLGETHAAYCWATESGQTTAEIMRDYFSPACECGKPAGELAACDHPRITERIGGEA